MLKQTTNSLVLDKFKIPEETLASIAKDEGKIVEFEDTFTNIRNFIKRNTIFGVPMVKNIGIWI